MTTTGRIALTLVVALLVTGAFAGGWVIGRTGMGAAVDEGSLSDVERAFTERMRNSALVGHFTVDGRAAPGAREDRYDIAQAVKVGDNLWRFDTRMRHEGMDVTLPITVPLQFVGDTPMVMMTDYSIPTLGTFTCRVFFYGTRYGGTWQHGNVGGLMYGRIEKGTEAR